MEETYFLGGMVAGGALTFVACHCLMPSFVAKVLVRFHELSKPNPKSHERDDPADWWKRGNSD